MDADMLKAALEKINEQMAEEFTHELTTIYNTALPNIIMAGNFSDLGAVLKENEWKLIRPIIKVLPEKCERLVLEALIKSGLPPSRTMPVWDLISHQIGHPPFYALDDAVIRAKVMVKKVTITKPSYGRYTMDTVRIVMCGICLVLIKYAPIPIKFIAGTGTFFIGAFYVYRIFHFNQSSNGHKQTAFNINSFLNKQKEKNIAALNAYVQSVTDAALTTMRDEL